MKRFIEGEAQMQVLAFGVLGRLRSQRKSDTSGRRFHR
jgi:hypothetical protein